MGYGKLRALFRGDLKASDTAFYRDTGSLASQEPDNDRFALGRLPMGGQEDVECDNMLISAQLAQTTHAKNLPVESPDPALPTFDCNDPEAVLPAAKKHYIIAPPSFLALLGYREKGSRGGYLYRRGGFLYGSGCTQKQGSSCQGSSCHDPHCVRVFTHRGP